MEWPAFVAELVVKRRAARPASLTLRASILVVSLAVVEKQTRNSGHNEGSSAFRAAPEPSAGQPGGTKELRPEFYSLFFRRPCLKGRPH